MWCAWTEMLIAHEMKYFDWVLKTEPGSRLEELITVFQSDQVQMFFKWGVTKFAKDIKKASIILEAATGNLVQSVSLTPNGESVYYKDKRMLWPHRSACQLTKQFWEL